MAIRGKTIFCQFSTHQELKTERKIGTNGALLADPIIPAVSKARQKLSINNKKLLMFFNVKLVFIFFAI